MKTDLKGLKEKADAAVVAWSEDFYGSQGWDKARDDIRAYITALEASLEERERAAWDAAREGMCLDPTGDFEYDYRDIEAWREAEKR